MRIAEIFRWPRAVTRLAFAVIAAGALTAAHARADDQPPPPHNWVAATLLSSGAGADSIAIPASNPTETLSVIDPELRWEIRALGRPHRLMVDRAEVNGRPRIAAIGTDWKSGGRALAILGALTFWLLLAAIMLGGQPWRLVVGFDNRYSNSKLQLALWFTVVLTSYTAVVILRAIATHGRLIGGVAIPQNLLLLSGLSALTFAGAKAITQGKVDQGAAATGGVTKTRADHPQFPRDLFISDSGHADLGDFQMLLVTLLAIGVYAMLLVNFLEVTPMSASLTLPDVDPTILAVFGLGQGAYLAKKFVSRPGEG
jgi:hypothetical protein